MIISVNINRQTKVDRRKKNEKKFKSKLRSLKRKFTSFRSIEIKSICFTFKTPSILHGDPLVSLDVVPKFKKNSSMHQLHDTGMQSKS